MKNKIGQVALLMLVLSACTSGYQFKQGKFTELDIHSLKEADYGNIFGSPFKTTSMSVGSDKYKIVWYHFGAKLFLRRWEARNLILEFKNDYLNGYLYASSMSNDKTCVDLNSAEKIRIGVSVKDDVVLILGKPYGKVMCPTQMKDFKDSCITAKEVWAWTSFELAYGLGLIENKSVFVMFDENGKVIDLKTTDIK